MMSTRQLVNAASGSEGFSLMKVLQESFACGVFAVAPNGNVSALTPRTERILRGANTATSLSSASDLPAPLQSILHGLQKNGKVVTDRVISWPVTDGGKVTVAVTAMPISDTPGRPTVLVLLKDLSSAERLEQSLRRLDRLASVGTVSASMAHEIKNALVAVKTFVDLLLEKNLSTELAGTVRREMDRVDAIVSRMLKFAAPAKLALGSIRLHDILEHSLRLAQHRAASKRIAIEKQFMATTDQMTGDDHQLEQAFVNLMLNAVEAIGSEGQLTVNTAEVAENLVADRHPEAAPGRALRVKITDTGAGIAPENIGRIFEPFFTTKSGGTGLGLSVTRHIIEQHRGSIRVESCQGQGTTFIVLLPKSEKRPAGARRATAA